MASPVWALLSELMHETSRCLFWYLRFSQKHTCPKGATHSVLSHMCGTRLCFQDEPHTSLSSPSPPHMQCLADNEQGWQCSPHICHLRTLWSRQWPAFSNLEKQLSPESLFLYVLFSSLDTFSRKPSQLPASWVSTPSGLPWLCF